MNYQQKYLKYKAMYLELKGGAVPPLPYWSHKDSVLAAITQDAYATDYLEYASQELRKDREVVLRAVTNNGRALRYAFEALKGDKKLVLAAVTQNGLALQHASEELQGDREVVLTAVAQYVDALGYASPELRADREMVLTAVTHNGWALEYASQELRADREVCLVATSQETEAVEYISPELKNEIKNYEGGASALLEHYEKNLEVNFTELSGDRYSLENLQGLDSIETIKERLNIVNPELGLDYDITYDGEEIHDIFEFRRIFFNEDDPVFMFRFH